MLILALNCILKLKKESIMKRISSLLLVLLCFFIVVDYSKSEPKQEAWYIYKGELAAYRVEINEFMRGDVSEILFHLEPINGYKDPTPKPFAMSGHDFDGDGQFDRIFIREKSARQGCLTD